MRAYRLDENEQPYPVDIREAARAGDFEQKWHQTTSVGGEHGFLVSTVFLVVDHSFWGAPRAGHTPILFETMIFDKRTPEKRRGGNDVYQDRYATIAEAREGHRRAIAWMKKHQHDDPIPYGPDRDEEPLLRIGIEGMDVDNIDLPELMDLVSRIVDDLTETLELSEGEDDGNRPKG